MKRRKRRTIKDALFNPVISTYILLLASLYGLKACNSCFSPEVVSVAFPEDRGFGVGRDYRSFEAHDRNRDGEMDRIVFNTGRLPDPFNPLPIREIYDERSSEFNRLSEEMSGDDFFFGSKRFLVHKFK